MPSGHSFSSPAETSQVQLVRSEIWVYTLTEVAGQADSGAPWISRIRPPGGAAHAEAEPASQLQAFQRSLGHSEEPLGSGLPAGL